MKKCISFCLLIILAAASPMFALDTADQKTIHQMIEHFSNAWNHQSGQGSASYYAQDADFVNIFGMAFAGKQEIETRHIKIHETFLKGSTFEVVDLKLREASPEVVIAHVYWKVSNIQKPGKESVNETMKGVFTHVFLKTQGKWEITATQNTPIPN
jgi:uncharacterized protein (TIGR02246 family)